MTQALWIAKTGLDAQQTRMAVISNNLANINTTGFKRDRANFEDLLYQTQRQPGGATSEQTMLPSGMSTGTGVRVATTAKSFVQGNLSQTGNALDVAINGRGFFEVLMPDGSSAYTRDGAFQVNADNELVTNEGYPVQPGLQIPEGAQSITIGSDGTVSVQLQGQAAATQVGQLTITDFVNPPACIRRAATCTPRPAPPARPRPAPRAKTAPACWSRARWKTPTSTASRSWCR